MNWFFIKVTPQKYQSQFLLQLYLI